MSGVVLRSHLKKVVLPLLDILRDFESVHIPEWANKQIINGDF